MDSPLAARIGRVARHPGLLGVTLAVAFAFWAGAAFAVVDAPPEPNSPEGVASLLRWCWAHRDAQRYRDLFSADYQFIPGAPDLPWNRDDELRAAAALFGSGTGSQPGASSIEVELSPGFAAGTLYLPNEPYPQYQQVLVYSWLHVDRNGGTALDAFGNTLFHLVRGDVAAIPADLQARGFVPDPHRWYVQRWEDVPAENLIVDHPPVLTAPETLRVSPGPLTIDVTASDLDADAITSLTAAAPPGAIFTPNADNTAGRLTWSPSVAGVYPITFTASNRLSASVTTRLTVRVNASPHAALVLSPDSGTAPLLVRLDASGSVDPDGAIHQFHFFFGDGTPDASQAFPVATHLYQRGDWAAEVIVTDDDGASDFAKDTVSVTGHNDPPVASLVCSPGTGKAPLAVLFSTTNSKDRDGQIVSSLLDFGDGTSQTMSGTTATHTYGLGRFTATLTVTDNEGATGTATVVVSAHEDRPPIVTPPSTASVYARHLLSFQVSATDLDQDPVTTFVAHNLPEGATFVTTTNLNVGTFGWRPAAGDTGVYTVTFLAQNALADSATTTITVRPDRPPVITVASSFSARVGRQLHFGVSAVDPDGDPIGPLTATPLGTSTLQSSDGSGFGDFYWTPASGDEGDHTVTFTAANLLTATAQTVIHVGVANVPPIAALSATPLSGPEPLMVNFNGDGSQDPDGQIVQYQFDFGDGQSVWVTSPAVQHLYLAGTWTAKMRVTDDQGESSTDSVIVHVSSQPNLARNPSFEYDTRYWGPYAGSVLERIAGGHDGGTALQITGPPVINGSFGVNDSPDVVHWTLGPGLRYLYTAWVRSPSSHGQAKLRVTEYLIAGGVKLGMTTSAPVTLSPNWQPLMVEYTTTSINSTLDFQVRDFPLLPGEVFVTDDIAVRNVTGPNAGTGMAIGKEDVDGATMEDGGGGEVSFEPRLTPMPMRDGGTLSFVTTQSGALCVDLVDLSGRRVRRVMENADAPAGPYVLPIGRVGEDNVRLSAGVYFWRVAASEGVKSGRFVILP